jgi:hypothetical protein
MKRLAHRRFFVWAGLTVVALLMLFTEMGSLPRVQSNPAVAATSARFATPLSSPTGNGGKARWTVKKMSIVSKYPKGFDLVLDVSSSAGKVSRATALWRHSTTHPSLALGLPDASGKFVAHWTPLPDRNIPAWVGIDFWWQLTDEKGNNFETPHGYTEYADSTRQWNRLVSDDAVIHWEGSLPDDLGTQVATALAAQRQRYLIGWGKLLDYKPQIIIYANYNAWKEWNAKIVSTQVEGQTDPAWGSTIQVYDTEAPDPERYIADAVVLHEVEHLYQQTFGANGTYLMQVWFFEGDATYFEVYQPHDFVGAVKDMAAKGQLPGLVDGLSQRTGNGDPYEVGYAVWKYLEVTYGPDIHRKVWEQIGKGLPIGLSLQNATGKTLAELEQGFRAWVGAN